jgi:cytochrome c peroxidase
LAILAVQVIASALSIPLGLDLYMPVPESNPVTAEKIELGRRLFSDPRLSRDATIACSTCHRPDRAFSDGLPVAVGIDGRRGHRNAPALINRGYGRMFFWDARVRTLEEQVLRPIEDPNEMDSSAAEAARRVGLTTGGLSSALATYVRSILSGDSPFDRFVNGDRTSLTDEEQRGLSIFRGKGNCTACHLGPNFTDENVHNTGIAWDGEAFVDNGAGRGGFKTPTLRDVAKSAPYMHDGSIVTLEDVVAFYDRGGRPNPYLDREIHPLHLTDEEKRALVGFLRALSGSPHESGRIVPGGSLSPPGIHGTER